MSTSFSASVTATAVTSKPLVAATVLVATFMVAVSTAILSSAVVLVSTSFWTEVVTTGPIVGVILGVASALALAVLLGELFLPGHAILKVSVMAPSRLSPRIRRSDIRHHPG